MVRLRDGMWLPAEGVHTEYAEDVYEITPAADKQGVSLLCPVRQVHNRGHTLNTPTITLVSLPILVAHFSRDFRAQPDPPSRAPFSSSSENGLGPGLTGAC